MKNLKFINKLAILLVIALTVFSCDEDDKIYPVTNEIKSISDILAENNLSIFEEALTLVEANATINVNDGNHTVYAPTNEAFNALFSKLGVTSLDEIDNLETLILYHIREARIPEFSNNLTTGYIDMLATDPTGNNLSLHINTEDDGLLLNGTASTVEGLYDLGATNGIVHTINTVLIPPMIPDVAEANSDYSTFVSAIKQVALEETLRGEGPFTVFVPTNIAFTSFMQAVQSELGYASLSEVPEDLLKPVLEYHIIKDENSLIGDMNGQEKVTVQGETIAINGTVIDDKSEVDANVTLSDIQMVNGIVHVIDRVLLTTQFAEAIKDATFNVYLRAKDAGYATFIEAVDLVGLSDALKVDTFTAFAPNDAAFTGFMGSLGYSSLADFDIDVLKSVVEYHLVASTMLSADFTNGDVTTAQGENFTLDLTDPEAPVIVSKFGNPAGFEITDLGAVNGAVHGIKRVLISDYIVNLFGLGQGEKGAPIFALSVYKDALGEGFSAWDGWGGTYDYANTENVSNGTAAIKLDYEGQWGSAQIGAGGIDVSGYSTFHFSVYGDTATTVLVALCDCDTGVEVAITPGVWTEIEIPISEFGDLKMDAIRFKEVTNDGVGGQTIYIDDVGFDLQGYETVGTEVLTFGLPIYEEGFTDFFANTNTTNGEWSWDVTSVNTLSDAIVKTGDYSLNIEFTKADSGYKLADFNLDISQYSEMQFDIYTDDVLSFEVEAGGNWDNTYKFNSAAGQWTTVTIPLSALGNPSTINEIAIKFASCETCEYPYAGVYIDNWGFDPEVTIVSDSPVDPVADESLVYFNFNGTGLDSWWGDVANSTVTDEAASVDGTPFFNATNVQGKDWLGLFFRNEGNNFPGATIGTNIDSYVLKFDINVIEPFTDGVLKFRFEGSGGDIFYDWDATSVTSDGWQTITVPLTDVGVSDYSLVDNEIGVAYSGTSMLNFSMDNIRFEFQ